MKSIIKPIIGLFVANCMVGCATSSPYYAQGYATTHATPAYYSGQTCDRPKPPAGLGYYRSDWNYVPKPVPVLVPGGGRIMTPYPVLYTSPMVRAVEQW